MEKKKKKGLNCRENLPSVTTQKTREKKEWKKPTLEDVSGRVMAQPYIRFT